MVGCNMDCLNCPHPDCINPDPRARYPSWIYENRTPEYKQRQNERAKERREERRAKGLCTKCGKRPVQGTATCAECRRKRKTYVDRTEREKGVLLYSDRDFLGLCKRRGCDQKAMKGRKLCEKHYAESLDYIARATEASKKKRAERRKKNEYLEEC